jgi:hypothetical protein
MIEQVVGFCFSVICLVVAWRIFYNYLVNPYRGHAGDIMPPVPVMPDVTTDDQLGDALGDGAQWENDMNKRVKDLLYRVGCDGREVDWKRFEVLMDCALREIGPPPDMLGSDETIAHPRIHPIKEKPAKSDREQLEEFESNIVSMFSVPPHIIPMTEAEKKQRWQRKAEEEMLMVDQHSDPIPIPTIQPDKTEPFENLYERRRDRKRQA